VTQKLQGRAGSSIAGVFLVQGLEYFDEEDQLQVCF
jgi:hypothetical protein